MAEKTALQTSLDELTAELSAVKAQACVEECANQERTRKIARLEMSAKQAEATHAQIRKQLEASIESLHKENAELMAQLQSGPAVTAAPTPAPQAQAAAKAQTAEVATCTEAAADTATPAEGDASALQSELAQCREELAQALGRAELAEQLLDMTNEAGLGADPMGASASAISRRMSVSAAVMEREQDSNRRKVAQLTQSLNTSKQLLDSQRQKIRSLDGELASLQTQVAELREDNDDLRSR